VADPAGPDSEAALIAAVVDHYNRGQLKEAQQLCLRALQLNPRNARALHLDGKIALAKGDAQVACERLERALAVQPSADVLVDLAIALQETGDSRGAAQRCRDALALAPAHAGAHHELGAALYRLERYDDAAASFSAALRLRPESLVSRLGLAQALLGAGKFGAVQKTLKPVLRGGQPHPRALVLHAIASYEQCEFAAAIGHLEKALALEPRDTGTLIDLANVYRDSGNFAKATECYERVIALAPDSAEARYYYAQGLVARGQYERGWDLFEARWEVHRHRSPHSYPRPLWNGEPLQGKRILVWPEQGIGDQIMFAGILPQVERLGASCALVSEPRLVSLLSRSFPAARVVARRSEAHHALVNEAFDFQSPLGSLARHLRKSAGDFPRHQGYLRADPERTQAWAERLAALGPGRKIGISWRGGTAATRGRLRSINLEAWLPILRVAGARFISLQYTDCAQEIAALRSKHGIEVHHWQEAIDDYDETAALVCALDLVVSVCTSAVHLAGALGRPAWVLVPVIPEWRYMSDGESMPWYPSVRLFRQRRYLQWDGVIDRVAGLLREPGGG
jgi:tetratricopeptide (TPR) repeat protein